MEPPAPGASRAGKYVHKEPVEVWAFTSADAYSATAHRLEGQRLSDVANDILSSALKGPKSRFLPLTEVTIHPLGGGTPIASPFVALNKGQVVLLGERGTSPASVEPAAVRPGLRRVAVRLLLSSQIGLTGAIISQSGRRTLDVLNDEREYLPVVGATVRWPAGAAGQFDFVAVNKAHIQRLEEIAVGS
ncbi:MAG: hypothetical protein U0556_08995 [Dehalococcoidia bacterium]